MLNFIDNEEQRKQNVASVSVAKLTLQVVAIARGFSGAKGPAPKLDMKDFLPFPDWSPEVGEQRPPDGPSPETRATLTRMLKARRIPMPIYAALIAPPD